MKKFAFSLEKVLSFREQNLSVLKSELGALRHELTLIDEDIARLRHEYNENDKSICEQMQKGASAGQISLYKLYMNKLTATIKKRAAMRAEQEKKIEAKQAEVVEANIEIAGLEKLKEKQFIEYRRLEQKAAETELEEFIGNLSAM